MIFTDAEYKEIEEELEKFLEDMKKVESEIILGSNTMSKEDLRQIYFYNHSHKSLKIDKLEFKLFQIMNGRTIHRYQDLQHYYDMLDEEYEKLERYYRALRTVLELSEKTVLNQEKDLMEMFREMISLDYNDKVA